MNEFTLDMSRMMGQQPEEPTKTPPDILAHTLLETYQRHIKGNPFKPGDLVTPRKGHHITGAGDPYVVLRTFYPVESVEPEVDGHAVFVADMRVLGEIDGGMASYYADSLFYEPWTGDIAIV